MKTNSFYVAFDEAHKPRGKITGNYSHLKEFLESQGFICQTFMEFPITRQNLSPYDILVIPCPDFAKFSTNEIDAIAQWVKEDGGGLLALSHAGGDKGRRSNLSELVEKFGLSFENDQVLDYSKNFGLENLPEVVNFAPPHPITEGITSLCFRAGCSLSSVGLSVVPVAISNEESDPFSTPLIVTAEVQEGRVIAIGSYEMFRNEIPGGFQQPGHKEFCTNIFQWLKTEYREKVKKGEIKPKVTMQEPAQKMDANGGTQPLFTSSKLNLSSHIIISDKSDLANLFCGLLDEVTVLKDQIKTVIDTIVSSEEQILESQKAAEAATQPELPLFIEPLPLPEPEKLTEMPEKPKSMKNTKKKAAAKPPKKKKVKPKPAPEPLPMTKEEIEAELETLKNKLNSIENLKDLVESKYKNKSYTKAQYEKQIERLSNDLNRSLNRIKELELQYTKGKK
ncbi:MAG: hypothetical protein ACTSRE_02785 [Promethearchaeota archaeon]